MQTEYNTPISLSNICDGALEKAFADLYPQVVASLRKGQKGAIKITLNMERPANAETALYIEFKMTPTFPAKTDVGSALITTGHQLKVARPNEATQLSILQGGDTR